MTCFLCFYRTLNLLGLHHPSFQSTHNRMVKSKTFRIFFHTGKISRISRGFNHLHFSKSFRFLKDPKRFPFFPAPFPVPVFPPLFSPLPSIIPRAPNIGPRPAIETPFKTSQDCSGSTISPPPVHCPSHKPKALRSHLINHLIPDVCPPLYQNPIKKNATGHRSSCQIVTSTTSTSDTPPMSFLSFLTRVKSRCVTLYPFILNAPAFS